MPWVVFVDLKSDVSCPDRGSRQTAIGPSMSDGVMSDLKMFHLFQMTIPWAGNLARRGVFLRFQATAHEVL
jgi:hypothetical protein